MAMIWSIQEGNDGGSITDDGVYTAPNRSGIFHIIATSQADSTKSKYEDGVSVREDILINLRFDVDLLDTRIVIQFLHLYFIIKMSDVTDYCLVLHL